MTGVRQAYHSSETIYGIVSLCMWDFLNCLLDKTPCRILYSFGPYYIIRCKTGRKACSWIEYSTSVRKKQTFVCYFHNFFDISIFCVKWKSFTTKYGGFKNSLLMTKFSWKNSWKKLDNWTEYWYYDRAPWQAQLCLCGSTDRDEAGDCCQRQVTSVE